MLLDVYILVCIADETSDMFILEYLKTLNNFNWGLENPLYFTDGKRCKRAFCNGDFENDKQ